jgi:hypothetical protein
MKNRIKNKNLMKYKSSVFPHNLDKTKEKYEVFKNELIDQY